MIKDIGSKIRKVRKSLGLSLTQMSDYLDKDITYVVGIENNNIPIKSDVLNKINKICLCNLEDVDIDNYSPRFNLSNLGREDMKKLSDIFGIIKNQREMDKINEKYEETN